MAELRLVRGFFTFGANIFRGLQMGGGSKMFFFDNLPIRLQIRYLGDGDTDGCEILHNVKVPHTKSLLLWAVSPGDPEIQNIGPLKTEYLQNGKSQR